MDVPYTTVSRIITAWQNGIETPALEALKKAFSGFTSVICVDVPSDSSLRGLNLNAFWRQLVGLVSRVPIHNLLGFQFSRLERIEVGVCKLEEHVRFHNCPNLKEVHIGYTETIPRKTFTGRLHRVPSSLERVSICTRKVEEEAFSSCDMLSDVWIRHPRVCSRVAKGICLDGVEMGWSAFEFAFSKTEGVDLYTTHTNMHCFANSGVRSVTVRDTDKIDYGSFFHCELLESLNIDSSVETIDDKAFGSCHRLSRLVWPLYSAAFRRIGEEAFSNCDLRSLVLYAAQVGQFAFLGNRNLVEVRFMSPVRRIQESAFLSCGKLKKMLVNTSTAVEWNVENPCWWRPSHIHSGPRFELTTFGDASRPEKPLLLSLQRLTHREVFGPLPVDMVGEKDCGQRFSVFCDGMDGEQSRITQREVDVELHDSDVQFLRYCDYEPVESWCPKTQFVSSRMQLFPSVLSSEAAALTVAQERLRVFVYWMLTRPLGLPDIAARMVLNRCRVDQFHVA